MGLYWKCTVYKLWIRGLFIIMSRFYNNFEVPIPPEAHALKCGRVQLYNYIGGNQQRLSLGKVTSNGMMNPNDRYMKLYPDKLLELYPEARDLFHPAHLSVGLFALTLGIGCSLGLYPLLCKSYGVKFANGIMDFAMYNIHEQKDSQELLAASMYKQMMFSVKAYEDSWYSHMFCHVMNDEHNSYFLREWLTWSLSICSKKALLSIDGSNIECSSKQCEKVERGHNKEHTSNKIVSFMWVICASGAHKGMPITYFVYEGSKVDCKAIKSITASLKAYKVEVTGAILDRGFCTDDCVKELDRQSIPYEIMMTSNTAGYNTMMAEHAEEIFNHASYMLENSPGRYGVTDTDIRFFKKAESRGCTALFYDDIRGSAQRTARIREVVKERRKLNKDLSLQSYTGIPKKFANVLKFDSDKGIIMDKGALEEELHTKGYSAIMSSTNCTAEEIDAIYDLRDTSEKVFMQTKSQLGYDTIRGYSTESIYNRFFCCFIASILRSEMVNVCKRYDLDTNLMIVRLDNLEYEYNGSGYEYASSLTKVQQSVFSEFGLNNESVALLSEGVNERLKVDVDSVHRPTPRTWLIPKKKEKGFDNRRESYERDNLPIIESVKEGEKVGGKLIIVDEPVIEPSDVSASSVKEESVAGQPVQGTKSTDLAAESQVESPKEIAIMSEQGPSEQHTETPTETPKKRGRGRPPKSKNKKTLEMEASMAQRRATGEPIFYFQKPTIGRPKKPETIQKEENEQLWNHKADVAGISHFEYPKRGRGRPTKASREEFAKQRAEWEALVEKFYTEHLSSAPASAP